MSPGMPIPARTTLRYGVEVVFEHTPGFPTREIAEHQVEVALRPRRLDHHGGHTTASWQVGQAPPQGGPGVTIVFAFDPSDIQPDVALALGTIASLPVEEGDAELARLVRKLVPLVRVACSNNGVDYED